MLCLDKEMRRLSHSTFIHLNSTFPGTPGNVFCFGRLGFWMIEMAGGGRWHELKYIYSFMYLIRNLKGYMSQLFFNEWTNGWTNDKFTMTK
jgi:hypothetical protein